eukprot:7935399-Heterocapsa_arctica.AAC.1
MPCDVLVLGEQQHSLLASDPCLAHELFHPAPHLASQLLSASVSLLGHEAHRNGPEAVGVVEVQLSDALLLGGGHGLGYVAQHALQAAVAI